MTDSNNSEELQKIIAELADPDHGRRETAMMRLKRFVNVAAEDGMVVDGMPTDEQLNSWHSAEQRVLNKPQIAEALIRAIDDDQAKIRALAAIELRDIEAREAERALVNHLRHDPHHQVRMMCVSSLRSRKPCPPVEVFIEALDDPHAEVVYVACKALGDLEDPRAVIPLRRMTNHESWNVRFNACEALVRLRAVDAEVVAELEALAQLPEAAEHDEIMQKVVRMDKLVGGTFKQPPTTRAVLNHARRLLNLDSPSGPPSQDT